MKKVLIAFLTVLMLITFVSCNDKNDKALEEAEKREQATIDFLETFPAVFFKYWELQDPSNKGDYDLAKYNSEKGEDVDAKIAANTMINILLWANNIKHSLTDFKVTSAKGTVKITATTSTDKTVISWTAKDVEVSYQYKDEESKEVTGKISLGGDVYMKQIEDTAKEISTVEVIVKSFMANGKTYKPIELFAEKTINGLEVKKAICDGIELNKKMVRVAIDIYFGIS